MEKMLTELGFEIPRWIEQDLYPSDIRNILQGGCASGAYMPAVTYCTARETMGQWGDDVLEFIESQTGELPVVPKGESWSGIACFYLSYAVELWASNIESELPEDE